MSQFTVQYGQLNANGKSLTKGITASEPIVLFKGDPTKVYTLLMSDPDASAKSWLHWLITNIPGSLQDIQEGQTIMPYSGPNPPSGTHRYIFTLYSQPAGSIMVKQPSERGNFSVQGFENLYTLEKVASRTVRVSA
jgi:phosphatidylethanolamine-binding protein (PEBP) family uncharacterized protein